ncbi:unnamed protein product [Larinioides sclopetarius]|uniref:N-acetyltransferase domain-containing protein n=1 Tax=Larinioides sclopetarius TaxID=280406 RepID=A0AAV2AKU1_9ARAC
MAALKYTVRLMTKDDVPEALEVWSETGMQEASHCLYTWLEVDKDAFNIAVTDSGKVIAVCAAVFHHPDFAFVGLYCCLERYRGRGIGKKVWDACMEHIGTRNAGLDAVPGTLELYRDKGGFPIVETRWTCVMYETENPINHEALSEQVPSEVSIEPFQDAFLPAMAEYDLALVGFDRKLALGLNCKESGSKTLVAFEGGKCVGFGTIKTSCHRCRQVGPLYADDAAVAEVMLKRLIVSFPTAKGLAILTISTNSPANSLLKKIGCPVTEEYIRLYRKEKMEVDTNKVFAQWDLNFCPH